MCTMGLSSSRQDEDMFLAMLSPSQKARLLKKKPTPSVSLSSQQKNTLQKTPQKRKPIKLKEQSKNEPRKKQNTSLTFMTKSFLIPAKLTQSSLSNANRTNNKTQHNALLHTHPPGVLCNDGLYADFSFFSFRPAEIAYDFYILDIHNRGVISRQTLGMALTKQFTKFSVVCLEIFYKLSATLEDFLFIWEYADFETITCETYIRICYLFYHLPKLREFPSLISYYLHDINYSQCLSMDAFINSLTAFYGVSNSIIKDKVRDYERSLSASRKNTFSVEDFIYICNHIKIHAKKKHLIDRYLLKLQSLDSLPLLTNKYRLDPIARSQPSTFINTIHNTVSAALTYSYSASGIVYGDCALTINNLKEFNRLRTKDCILRIVEEYQLYINKTIVSKSPLAKASMADETHIKANRNEEWSSTSSNSSVSSVEVFNPLFKRADSNIKTSNLHTHGEKEEKSHEPDSLEIDFFNTPVETTTKISLSLNAQDTLSETQSVIYSFEVDSHGQLRRIKTQDDIEQDRIHKKDTAIVKDTLSQRLAMIATVHVAKGYTREVDFEGDNEVGIAKSGSFCAFRDVDKLQLITQFPGL